MCSVCLFNRPMSIFVLIQFVHFNCNCSNNFSSSLPASFAPPCHGITHRTRWTGPGGRWKSTCNLHCMQCNCASAMTNAKNMLRARRFTPLPGHDVGDVFNFIIFRLWLTLLSFTSFLVMILPAIPLVVLIRTECTGHSKYFAVQ